MNRLLMKQDGKHYQTFIKILFEGLLNNYLLISNDEYLYRGSKMSKIELEKIITLFNKWKKKDDKSFPSFILYSRCFLSFSKDENAIMKFIGENDDKNYGIVFILKNNKDIINKYSSNADIELLSAFSAEEREVLFFPFSSFCLENIQKGNFKGKNCIIINLEYLGKYKDTLDSIKKDENFKNNFIYTLDNQNFSKEIIKSNIIPISNTYNNINDKKQVFKKIKNKINDKYNIEIKEDLPKEKEKPKPEEKMEVIEIGENILLQEKSPQKDDEKQIENNLIKIKEDNKKKSKHMFIYFTSFKPEEMEYIWRGDFDEVNKKTGKGKEYDFDDNIIFEGEYINNLRIKGVEYYIKGTKKFEGEYKNNKRWNFFFI